MTKDEGEAYLGMHTMEVFGGAPTRYRSSAAGLPVAPCPTQHGA